MDAMLRDNADTTRALRSAMRASDAFWITYWYASRPAGTTHRATVAKWIRRQDGLAVVVFDETGHESAAKVDERAELGSAVDLVVMEANPFYEQLRFGMAEK